MLPILYYYRAVGGVEVPYFEVTTPSDLESRFRRSATPLARQMVIETRQEAELAVNLLQAQLTATPDSESGLRFSIGTTISKLREWAAHCTANRQTA